LTKVSGHVNYTAFMGDYSSYQKECHMTPLRASYIAHLELKYPSAKTRRNYLDPVILLSKWLKRSPDTITKTELQQYLLHLKLERKLAIRSLNIHIYGLKCFFDFILPETNIM
jgi:hypothetical protein